MSDRFAAASGWYRSLLLDTAATSYQLGAGAWAVRDDRWPSSYMHNCVLVDHDPGGDRLLAWGDDALEGLPHRYVIAYAGLSEATLGALHDAGFELQPEVLMERPVDAGPLPPPAGVEVVRVDAARSRPFELRMWREEYKPGIGDDALSQLVDRPVAPPGTPVGRYAVVDPSSGDIAALATTRVRDGIGELDGVATRAPFRGRGYGDALLAAVAADVAAAGCDALLLEALVDDWPWEWYQRRGFRVLGRTWTATRTPTD